MNPATLGFLLLCAGVFMMGLARLLEVFRPRK